jgi:germination protein YpeB
MRRRTAVRIISFLLAALAAVSGVAWSKHKRAEALHYALEVSHQHAFAELVTGMSELDSALQKSLYAKSPTVISAVCTDVFGKAMPAQMSLGALPFSTQELEKTAGFISRVGDYAYSLSRAGRAYTDEEEQNLRKLSETATALAENFRTLQQQLTEGGITMDELAGARQAMDAAEENAVDDSLSGSMRLIEEEFPEIPSLIYDGPFSEHIKSARPRALEGLARVSESEAKRAAAEFLGLEEAKLQSLGKSTGRLPCWYFDAGGLTVQVTEQGGRVMNLISAYAPEKSSMSAADAAAIAGQFLAQRGFESMAESYHMIQDGVCTVNFAYSQDGVICYPDLVKVSVALDGGTVVGFECAGYLNGHTQRALPEVSVDAETARAQIGELTEKSHRLAVIPTAGQYEKLCHEFVCTADGGGQYIIYVNAETGEQEKILILLEDENGSLTI